MSDIKIVCPRCGSENTKRQLYNSQSELYKYHGVIPICKQCVVGIYDIVYSQYQDDDKAIYTLCRRLDLPYSRSALNAAQSMIAKNGWKIHQAYITQINSIGGANNYGKSFNDGDDISSSSRESILDVDDPHDDFEITQDMRWFWGSNYDPEQYRFLCNFYESLLSSYECETPIQENIYKNIAKAQLQADIALEQGRMPDYDKAMKTLSALMNDGNIKPVQETGADAAEQATFGTLIKKWENEDPIPEPLGRWKKANWIEKYMRTWFFGHLARMMDKENPFQSEYDEEIEKYKVDMEDEDGGDDINGII